MCVKLCQIVSFNSSLSAWACFAKWIQSAFAFTLTHCFSQLSSIKHDETRLFVAFGIRTWQNIQVLAWEKVNCDLSIAEKIEEPAYVTVIHAWIVHVLNLAKSIFKIKSGDFYNFTRRWQCDRIMWLAGPGFWSPEIIVKIINKITLKTNKITYNQ